jgi:hypothetical protein
LRYLRSLCPVFASPPNTVRGKRAEYASGIFVVFIPLA